MMGTVLRALAPAAAAAAALSGCGSFPTITEERQTASTGFIGCAPKEIAIADQERYTWTATCRGRTFYCTVSPEASCKERIAARPTEAGTK